MIVHSSNIPWHGTSKTLSMLQTDVIFLNHYWADSADLEIAESLQITIRKVDMNSSWLKWMSRPFPLKLKEWNGSLYLQLCRIWAWQFSYLTLYCFGDIGKRKIFYQSCCIILHPKLGLQSSSSCLSMLWGGQNVCMYYFHEELLVFSMLYWVYQRVNWTRW